MCYGVRFLDLSIFGFLILYDAILYSNCMQERPEGTYNVIIIPTRKLVKLKREREKERKWKREKGRQKGRKRERVAAQHYCCLVCVCVCVCMC